MSASNWVHLENCTIESDTEKALLVSWGDDDEREQRWIPRSQISEEEQYERGDTGLTISITEWWANKEGIET